ncbi:MAG: ROK family protein [Labilithrix sp.]|nr:ROK family protein [Labilithrix sp.]
MSGATCVRCALAEAGHDRCTVVAIRVEERPLLENYGHGLVIAGDVGGTKTAVGLYDVGAHELVAVARFPTPTEDEPSAFVERFAQAAEALIEGAGRQRLELRAAGLAVPGLVDARGRVVRAGKLRSWRDVALSELVGARLGVATSVEQDANAAALAERWRGVAAAMSDFVFLALGTGVGAGVVVDGKLLRGSHDAAGEVGDLRELGSAPGPAGVKLGNRIGGKAIAADASLLVRADLAAAQAIAGASGDPRLEELADEVAELVSIAVFAIITVVDPEAIVFGGGTAAAGDALLARVRTALEGHVCAIPHLVVSALGEDAQLFGAVYGGLSLLERSPG